MNKKILIIVVVVLIVAVSISLGLVTMQRMSAAQRADDFEKKLEAAPYYINTVHCNMSVVTEQFGTNAEIKSMNETDFVNRELPFLYEDMAGEPDHAFRVGNTFYFDTFSTRGYDIEVTP
jgi:Asp-tRNA(Asn)/Glu-tRNA(Gln) amidotransferase B subunit